MFFADIPQQQVVEVLAPEWQERREKDAIMQDPRLAEKIGNQVVLEVQKVDGGYVVVTDLCEMQIDVRYLPPSKPGIIGEPTRFELSFQEPHYFK